jgi:prepilin-type N-terminal cleavage/methylation domain-containing protein
MQDAGCGIISRSRSSSILHPASRIFLRAFTLVEIMVVVGIIAIVMTIAVPFMRTAFETPRGMGGAVKVLQEAASNARALAILRQTTTELVIRPREGTFEVSMTGGSGERGGGIESVDGPRVNMASKNVAGEDWRMADRKTGGGGGGGRSERDPFSGRLPSGIQIEGLGVNGEDWTEDDVAKVRFYSNGTCDEMSIVLISDSNERRNVWLEVVTGYAEIESDPRKFKAR